MLLLQLAFTYGAPMQCLFATRNLDAESWLVIVGLSLPLLFIVEGEKALLRRRCNSGSRSSGVRPGRQDATPWP